MVFAVLEDSARTLDSYCCKIEVELKCFLCLCIKAQLTRLHSASLVIEPCGETAAQLERREMEEYVIPEVRTHVHVHTRDT